LGKTDAEKSKTEQKADATGFRFTLQHSLLLAAAAPVLN